MPEQQDFDGRLRSYLARGAGRPAPSGMEPRIIRLASGRKTWGPQLVAAVAVVVLAVGLGVIFQRARQSNVVRPAATATATALASPSVKPTLSPTPATSAKAYPLLPPSSMHMLNATSGWAAGSGTNRILRTSDGGAHWDDVTPKSARAGTWMTYFLDANNAWVGSSLQPGSGSPDFSVVIYRTIDGGRNWQETGQVAADQGWPASMDFVDRDHGWLFMNLGSAAGSQGVALYGTANGGTTWTKLSEADTSGSPGHLPLSCSKGVPVFLNRSTGWIPGACNAGGGPFLFVTRDGGRTWNPVSIAVPAGYSGNCMCDISSLQFSDPTTGVFVLDIYGTDGAAHNFLYATPDGGTSWLHGWVLPPNSFSVDFLTGAVGWTLDAKSSTVLYSHDGGQHWSTLGTIPSSQGVMGLQFVNAAIGWAMGSEPTGNTLIKTSDGGRTWTTQLSP